MFKKDFVGICMAPDLEKIRGGAKNVKFFGKKLCEEMIPKASRIIYTTFFAEIRPNSPRFEPILRHA